MDLVVRQIESKDAYPFLLNIHYAKRIPSISYAYGLFDNEDLIGVVTYGTPPSSALRRGIAGDDNINIILELNRLCLKFNRKNEASYLVGNSIKLLPKGRIIVSYADTSQNHLGIVYQACNFIYTGLSAKRSDYKISGLEHLHSQTILDQFRGQKDRTKSIKEFYGDRFYMIDRPRKHRYVYITGSKTMKKKLLKQLKYPISAYPKWYWHNTKLCYNVFLLGEILWNFLELFLLYYQLWL